MGKRLSDEQVLSAVESRGYSLLNRGSSKIKMTLSCLKHGEFSVSWTNFSHNKSGCPRCYRDRQAANQKTPWPEIQAIASSKNYQLVTTQEEYLQNSHRQLKLRIICSCGLPRAVHPHSLKSTSGCIKCKKANTSGVSLDDLRSKAADLNLTILSTSYENSKSYVQVSCPKHGEFSTIYNSLQQGHGCIECGLDRSRLSNQAKKTEFGKIASTVETMGGTLKSSPDAYLNNRAKLDVTCKHGHDFQMSWQHLRNGVWCPRCVRTTSKQEQEIFEFVRSLAPDAEANNRTILSGQELDIWVPSKNLGIEYNGLYWHSERNDPKAKEKIVTKSKKISESGISFLGIFEDEWLDPHKRVLVQSMIRARLGMSENRLYARNLKLVSISSAAAREFLSINHLEGYVKSSSAVALTTKEDEIVACASFRRARGGLLELARMAFKLDTHIIGGASKLLSKIEEPLMSYSDNRVGFGNVYQRLGFKDITETRQPSYWYTDFKKRVFRTQCLRRQDLPGSEKEQAELGLLGRPFGHERPIYKIYGYGHRKWLRSKA